MKWLVVLLVVLAGVWLWRRGRQRAVQAPPRARRVEAIRPCRHCGVHVPEAEAVNGQHGIYCSAAHRQQEEGSA